MAFKLAKDVELELEKLSRLTKKDPNEILRGLLEMRQAEKNPLEELAKLTEPSEATILEPKFYTTPRGDRLPWGKIVLRLDKKEHVGEVNQDGIVFNGQRFDMPSPAAKSLAGYEINGWKAFRYEHKNGTRQPLDAFRAK